MMKSNTVVQHIGMSWAHQKVCSFKVQQSAGNVGLTIINNMNTHWHKIYNYVPTKSPSPTLEIKFKLTQGL